MKKYSLLVVIVLILSISFSNTVAAKGKKTLNNISKKATSEKTAESSLVVPFDINIEKLPANYKGTDITKLYSLLVKKAPLRKKEFETTVDYEKKIKSAVSDNVYAFRLDCFSKKDIEGSRYGAGGYVDYNADAQKLNIHISNDNHYFIKYLFEERRTTIVVKEIDKGSRSYKGSNAFGASRLVESFSSTLYLVAFAFDGLAIDSRLNIKIDMLPDKAKHLINNIGVLLLCKTE